MFFSLNQKYKNIWLFQMLNSVGFPPHKEPGQLLLLFFSGLQVWDVCRNNDWEKILLCLYESQRLDEMGLNQFHTNQFQIQVASSSENRSCNYAIMRETTICKISWWGKRGISLVTTNVGFSYSFPVSK